MLLNFDTMQAKTVEHMRGGEKYVTTTPFADDRVRIARGTLVPGASIGLHPHEGSLEVIYILSGEGRIECDGEIERVSPGLVHYCPEGSSHTFINDGEADITYFAVIPQV